jgi:2-keto-4-pentenoate hydratase/2-oxohepta-3-ene-1,7-dioic acid hydratase in catechol pathway
MKIVCVGLNYLDHAREVNAELPERPLLFAKWPCACIDRAEPRYLEDGDEVEVEIERIGVLVNPVRAEH